MAVESTADVETWGGWALGDLIAAIGHAEAVIGPSARVLSVHAEEPADGASRVLVRLHVREVEEAARLREEAALGEYVVRFLDEPQDEGWEARVNGIRLGVYVKEEW